jgi:hypothetical protein
MRRRSRSKPPPPVIDLVKLEERLAWVALQFPITEEERTESKMWRGRERYQCWKERPPLRDLDKLATVASPIKSRSAWDGSGMATR